MLVWGTKGKLFRNDATYSTSCKNCGHLEHLSYILAKYFHLFWIPTILWEKEIGLICTKCNGSITGSAISADIRAEVRKSLLPPRKKAPYFTGLVLVALLAAVGAKAHYEHKHTLQDLVAHPQAHDIYIADMSEFVVIDKGETLRYGALRVETVLNEGQVVAKIGNLRSDKAQRIVTEVNTGKAGADEAFGDSAILIGPAELQALMDNGTIKDIVRKG
ncbi:hypothetical protein JCM14124_19890 [Humidesulfovibrio idahonensis]